MLRWLLPTALAVSALVACAPVSQSAFGTDRENVTSDDADDDDDDDKPATPAAKAPAPATTVADAAAPTPSARDPFQGATGFASITPGTTTSDHHLGASNAHRNCLACHGKDMGAPELVFAGTIQKSASDDSPATDVQVRIIDPAGNEVASVGTDENGNFWLEGTTTLPAGSTVGIRDASGTQKMSGALASGSCNQTSCHNQDRPIFLGK